MNTTISRKTIDADLGSGAAMTDYAITAATLDTIQSSALRGIAGEVTDRLDYVLTIVRHPSGAHLADAIVYRELDTDNHYTMAIDDRECPIFYSLDATYAEAITDDDLDDSITDWMTCREIGFPDNIDAETPGGCLTS